MYAVDFLHTGLNIKMIKPFRLITKRLCGKAQLRQPMQRVR